MTGILQWVQENLHHDIGLDEIAAQTHMSRRTLVRRFNAALGISPIRRLQHERLRRAQQLHDTANLSIDQIAEQTGHGTATTLRPAFAAQIATIPSDYRRAFLHS
ncbi:helix-turn-helix domain-containing protein [Rathayibacter soli]|uniref:helix-turn-helix domain-containing protein n=1 Tax=Rathayibacter soli TaxID=3144168 RepID=UPI0027E419D2|nr:helix-turn-helix domain-containing protein [Glaciibacter superstes]